MRFAQVGKSLGNRCERKWERNALGPAATPLETALQWQASDLLFSSDRSVLRMRCRCSLCGSYAAVMMRQPKLVSISDRSVKGQRSMSTAPPRKPMGNGKLGSAVLFPVATSSNQSVGQECRHGWGYRVKRTGASGNVSRRHPSGERGSIPLSRSGMGGHSESRARILCGQTRVQVRDPPVFSAGNAGKSLTT